MSDIRKYILKRQRGVDDLLSEYAFIGNSQGDDSTSNEIGDYIGSKGWISFIFAGIDPTDQEAIYAESKRRHNLNLDYIDKLVKEGKYKEEYEITIEMEFNPIYDTPSSNLSDLPPLESCKLVFLDFSKTTEDGKDNE